jgi:hypothetical protein
MIINLRQACVVGWDRMALVAVGCVQDHGGGVGSLVHLCHGVIIVPRGVCVWVKPAGPPRGLTC